MNTKEIKDAIDVRLDAREPFGVPLENIFIGLEIEVEAQKIEIAAIREDVKLARTERMNIIERLDELVAKFNGDLETGKIKVGKLEVGNIETTKLETGNIKVVKLYH